MTDDEILIKEVTKILDVFFKEYDKQVDKLNKKLDNPYLVGNILFSFISSFYMSIIFRHATNFTNPREVLKKTLERHNERLLKALDEESLSVKH